MFQRVSDGIHLRVTARTVWVGACASSCARNDAPGKMGRVQGGHVVRRGGGGGTAGWTSTQIPRLTGAVRVDGRGHRQHRGLGRAGPRARVPASDTYWKLEPVTPAMP